jgi:hypothetical protein
VKNNLAISNEIVNACRGKFYFEVDVHKELPTVLLIATFANSEKTVINLNTPQSELLKSS